MPDPETIDATDITLKGGSGGLGFGGRESFPAPGTDVSGPGDSISGIVGKSSGLTGPGGTLTELARQRGSALDSADRTMEGRLERDRAERERAYRQEAAGPDSLPPKWDADAERAKRIRGPIEQFGSVGVIFALAASAFTKQPMTSALNGAAAAMGAIKAGDEEAYKSAYTAWKDNTELALKRFDMEHKLVEDADKLATTDMAEWKIQRLAIASKFDDKKTVAMLEAGLDPDVIKTTEAAVKARVGMVEAKEKMEDTDARLALVLTDKKAFKEANRIKDDSDPRVIMHSLQFQQMLASPAGTEQARMMKNFREEVWQKEHRLTTSDEEIKKFREIQQISARSNEIDRRTVAYETDPNSPTFGDHAASYDLAAKEVSSAKQAGASLTPGAIDSAARIYMKTGKFPPNVGRGAQGAANITSIQNRVAELERDQGKTPEQIAEGQRNFQTRSAGLRALETRRGRLLSSIYATDEMGDLLKQASDAVPRGKFTIVNKGTQAVQAVSSDPKLAAFTAAINSYVNSYASAISPTGQSRISDKEHAYELINKAMGTGAINAVVEQIHKETRAEMDATRKALKELSGDDDPGAVVPDKKVESGKPVGGTTPSGIQWSLDR